MKQQIEIDVPDGMRVATITNNGPTTVIELEPIPKTKRRPPTKHDLLGVDLLDCWVRDRDSDSWQMESIHAVSTEPSRVYPFLCTRDAYRYCEIEVPADEQPLREAWVRYYPNAIGGDWGTAWPRRQEPDENGGEFIHMIEVQP